MQGTEFLRVLCFGAQEFHISISNSYIEDNEYLRVRPKHK
jgi:hypothetical protein